MPCGLPIDNELSGIEPSRPACTVAIFSGHAAGQGGVAHRPKVEISF